MPDYEFRTRSSEIDALFDAILLLEDRNECYRFFEDVCTIAELNAIAQRWEVAKLLDQGITYQEIAKGITPSSATISRVNRCLSYGAGGYRLMLERMRGMKE